MEEWYEIGQKPRLFGYARWQRLDRRLERFEAYDFVGRSKYDDATPFKTTRDRRPTRAPIGPAHLQVFDWISSARYGRICAADRPGDESKVGAKYSLAKSTLTRSLE